MFCVTTAATAWVALALVAVGRVSARAPQGGLKNVVLFVADDLRPQLNAAYGQTLMKTPNLDKFSEQALVFDYAFTNYAICSPSRNSFMTGRSPQKTRVWNFINDFRQGGLSELGPGTAWTTLPEFFKNHGYTTLGHGKLYHPGHPPNWDEPASWSQTQPYVPPTDSACGDHGGGNFCPDGVSPIDRFSDRNVTLSAISTLKTLAIDYQEAGTNFFLGLGLHYPHQSWHVPLNVTAQYPSATAMAAAKHQEAPQNAPDIAFTAELDGVPELGVNCDLPGLRPTCPSNVSGLFQSDCPTPHNNTVPIWMQQQLRLGYYSAVTLTDTHFGMLMDALDASGVANETLVVVVSDHGWQLGEGAEWGKHTNWERAVHIPLMIRAPWLPNAGGQHTQSFFELVDLYPTMVGAAGLDPLEIDSDVDGIDQSSLLLNPAESLKNLAFAQYARCPGDRNWPNVIPNAADYTMNNCETVPSRNISFMGYTVRNREFRYTAWYRFNGFNCSARWEEGPYARELYSHVGEKPQPVTFDNYEIVNVANDSSYAPVVEALQAAIVGHFRRENTSCPADPGQPGPDPLPNSEVILQYSQRAHDSCTCTTTGCLNKKPEFNYTDRGVQGYQPHPGASGAVPLFHWWNSTRHDNYLTTATSVPNYEREETSGPVGWVLSQKPQDLAKADLVELQVWYNSAVEDHLTASTSDVLQWAQENGYVQLASLGWLYSRPTTMSLAAMEHML